MLLKNRGYAISAMLAIIFLLPTSSWSEGLVLRFPTDRATHYEYYYELIVTALEDSGHDITVVKVDEMPHLRTRTMLSHGGISLLWLIRSRERDEKYLPVPVNLTNGLIGQRILLIPEGQQHEYNGVTTLDEFRALNKTGAFGTNWYDTQVWRHNDLPFAEIANTKLIYRVLASGDRDIDYFSRGFNEIVEEHEASSGLDIEQNLMFVYDRDFIFYVTPKQPELVPILTDALTKARKSGLIDRLIREYWSKNYRILKPEGRTIIHLETPR